MSCSRCFRLRHLRLNVMVRVRIRKVRLLLCCTAKLGFEIQSQLQSQLIDLGVWGKLEGDLNSLSVRP